MSASWLASKGAAAASHYEDPSAGPCQSGEEAVQIQGVKGGFCSPQCGLSFLGTSPRRSFDSPFAACPAGTAQPGM